MAIYHLSVKIIGRSSGRSAVAAAAYRSGECITNEWDGVTHDFRKKNWVKFTEVLLPDHAPQNFKNRKNLWNAVEAAEKSKSAQLAREFELALPKELPHERQVELIEKFTNEELVSKGMCVDIAIHNPPKTNDRHQPVRRHTMVGANRTLFSPDSPTRLCCAGTYRTFIPAWRHVVVALFERQQCCF